MTAKFTIPDKPNRRLQKSRLDEKHRDASYQQGFASMKAIKTFYIGAAVALLSTVQFFLTFSPVRLIGIAVGLFLVIFGWKVGWTRNRNFTTILGHIAVTLGCLVSAYAIYQLPSMQKPPTILETIDMPLFWGLFTIFGGYCMITHGYCSCAIRMHEGNNCKGDPGKALRKDVRA